MSYRFAALHCNVEGITLEATGECGTIAASSENKFNSCIRKSAGNAFGWSDKMENMDLSNTGTETASNPQPLVILGGSGFIGTRLSSSMSQRGIPFRIGDLQKSTPFPGNWMDCDVRRHETLGKVCHGAAAIINLAAEHRDDVRPLSRYDETNVEGASQVCLAARKAGIQKIVFASTVAVYGFPSGPVDENGPFAPFNAYGKTKMQAECIYRAWAAEDPSRTLVIVRPTVVFGEGNRGNVYNLLCQVASGHFFMVGSGLNVKSMAYVGNVAAFLAYTLSLGPGIHTFNYADGPDMNTNELVSFIKQCLGIPGRTRHLPKPIAMAGGHLLDVFARLSGRSFPISAIRVRKFCETTQFRSDLVARSSFTPPYSLSEGLALTLRNEFPVQSPSFISNKEQLS